MKCRYDFLLWSQSQNNSSLWLTGKGSYVFSAIPDGTQPPPPHWGTNMMVVSITSISHFRCFSDIIIQSQFPSQYFWLILRFHFIFKDLIADINHSFCHFYFKLSFLYSIKFVDIYVKKF